MTRDAELIAAHLAKALIEHRRWCRTRGHRFPPLLEAILDALAVSDGQERPRLGEVPDAAEAEVVPAPLLFDDHAAALRLGIGDRSVRRLRETGKLPVVMIGRRRLIRVTDLEAFVAKGGSK